MFNSISDKIAKISLSCHALDADYSLTVNNALNSVESKPSNILHLSKVMQREHLSSHFSVTLLKGICTINSYLAHFNIFEFTKVNINFELGDCAK